MYVCTYYVCIKYVCTYYVCIMDACTYYVCTMYGCTCVCVGLNEKCPPVGGAVWAGGLAVQLCKRKCVTGGRVKVCSFQVPLRYELLAFCPGLYLPLVTLPHHDGSHLSRTMN